MTVFYLHKKNTFIGIIKTNDHDLVLDFCKNNKIEYDDISLWYSGNNLRNVFNTAKMMEAWKDITRWKI